MPTSAAGTEPRATPGGASEAAPEPGGGAEGISVRGVSKIFASGTEALTPTDFEVGPGQLVSVVGPSGCGKSTLLRVIAGLTPASTGECSLPTGSRRAFVFQDATLLPWRTVRKNAQLLLELE